MKKDFNNTDITRRGILSALGIGTACLFAGVKISVNKAEASVLKNYNSDSDSDSDLNELLIDPKAGDIQKKLLNPLSNCLSIFYSGSLNKFFTQDSKATFNNLPIEFNALPFDNERQLLFPKTRSLDTHIYKIKYVTVFSENIGNLIDNIKHLIPSTFDKSKIALRNEIYFNAYINVRNYIDMHENGGYFNKEAKKDFLSKIKILGRYNHKIVTKFIGLNKSYLSEMLFTYNDLNMIGGILYEG